MGFYYGKIIPSNRMNCDFAVSSFLLVPLSWEGIYKKQSTCLNYFLVEDQQSYKKTME